MPDFLAHPLHMHTVLQVPTQKHVKVYVGQFLLPLNRLLQTVTKTFITGFAIGSLYAPPPDYSAEMQMSGDKSVIKSADLQDRVSATQRNFHVINSATPVRYKCILQK